MESRKIVAQKAAAQQLENERRQDIAQLGVRQQATAHCISCRNPGHNSHTCGKNTVDTAQHGNAAILIVLLMRGCVTLMQMCIELVGFAAYMHSQLTCHRRYARLGRR